MSWRALAAQARGEAVSPDYPSAKIAEMPKYPPGAAVSPEEENFGDFGISAEPMREEFEERAALVEEGAGVPREWAEGFARLDAMPTPASAPPKDWRAVLDAASRFLDQWAAKAHALGWTAEELFGLDPHAPLARLDRRGAAFFLAGREVVAIDAEAITVRSGGVIQRFRRGTFAAASAWEALA